MRIALVVLVGCLAGCLQTPAAEELAVDYLATTTGSIDSATQSLVARAVGSTGIDLAAWPSPDSPITAELDSEPYSASLHALIALGAPPWIDLVWAGHDGEQFGSPATLTDDMLAVHGLLLAGEPRADPRIEDAVNRIKAAQHAGGGWRFDGKGAGEVDETAWALQMLVLAGGLEPQAREAAVDFLINARDSSQMYQYGGQANCQSTAWALVAWAALDVDPPGEARQALLECQNPDGGFGWQPGQDSQPWVTADALLGLTA